jgi:subtilisin-like proprotein convertase family protein
MHQLQHHVKDDQEQTLVVKLSRMVEEVRKVDVEVDVEVDARNDLSQNLIKKS